MKRSRSFEEVEQENIYELGDISLPSPLYSEPEDQPLYESPTKKHRAPPQHHDLNRVIEDSILEFVTPRGIQHRQFRTQGKPLVLVFFGVMKDHLDEINTHYSTITRSFNAEIIGASTNILHNNYDFPLVNGTLLTKKFNARDPVGGGVYPRDMMIFFDKHGRQRHEVLIRYNGRYTIFKPVVEVIKDVLEEMEDDQMLG